MIRSMTFIDTSLKLSTTWAHTRPFSPATRMPTPKRMAMTMTWSIEAERMGSMTLAGKMFTRVSIKLTGSLAVYSPAASLSRGGKKPRHRLASTRAMTTDRAVVHM